MTLADARRELTEVRRQRAQLEARLLDLVSHIQALSETESAEFVIPHREVTDHVGLTPREAHTVMARAEVVDAEPGFGSMLAAGNTSIGHLDAMARAFSTLGEERHKIEPLLPGLVAASTSMELSDFSKHVAKTARSLLDDGGLSTFERQRASTYFSMRRDCTGGFKVSGYFDPERGAAVMSLVEQRRERDFHSGVPLPAVMGWVSTVEHRNALALFDLLTSSHPTRCSTSSDGPASPRAEVVVHVDLATLTNGLHSLGTCRTVYGDDLPAQTARRLACEANIVPVVLSGEGVPLDVGRSRRLATAGQRRALEAIHHTCAVPDCDRPFHHCQIHHIEYWENGGFTDLDNMVPLCSRHHHDVHEGGWELGLDPVSRHVTFVPGNGPPD